MNPRFFIISALAVSIFATSLPVFAGKRSSQYETMTEDQREELLQSEIYKRLEGGMNSGGGNSIQGKVIESYRINYKKLKGYNEANSVLKKLNEYLPNFAADLNESSDKKLWFLVPAEFSTIPREISGIPAHSEQTALNREHVVWVSKPNLEAKSKEQAGILILHEMVMSYLKRSSMDETAELIAKTQVITSLLLDLEDYTDTEIADRLWDLLTVKYEPLSKTRADELFISERNRIYSKFDKDLQDLCSKHRIGSLAKQFAQKKLSAAEDAYYVQGLRSITVLELKLAYPSWEDYQYHENFLALIPVARNNKVYKADLQGIRLSDKIENKKFANSFGGITSGMTWICRDGCVPEKTEALRSALEKDGYYLKLKDICPAPMTKKPDQYGW